MTFLPGPANLSALEESGVEFLTVRNCPEKNKNLNLIKSVRKRNRTKRKGTRFFGFYFSEVKLVPINSELNSVWESQSYCYQK